MGLGFYGRSFTLANPTCDHEGCIFSTGANAGPCTDNVGTLSFAEIERVIAQDNASVTLNTAGGVEEVVWNGDQWVSFDDAQTFGMKYHYANGKCLGGLMVWAVSTDDRYGTAERELCESLGCTVHVPQNSSASSTAGGVSGNSTATRPSVTPPYPTMSMSSGSTRWPTSLAPNCVVKSGVRNEL